MQAKYKRIKTKSKRLLTQDIQRELDHVGLLVDETADHRFALEYIRAHRARVLARHCVHLGAQIEARGRGLFLLGAVFRSSTVVRRDGRNAPVVAGRWISAKGTCERDDLRRAHHDRLVGVGAASVEARVHVGPVVYVQLDD